MPNAKWFGSVPINLGAANATLDSSVQVPATAAGTAVELVLGVYNSPSPAVLNSITIIPQAAVAFNGTNYVTINLIDRGPTGAGTAVLATVNTSAVSQAAFTPATLTIDGTQAAVQQGDVLSLQVAKSGSGVATPPMLVILDWRY